MWINNLKILSPEIPNILPNNVGSALFLDLYTSARIAYSVRKLRVGYTGFCMRIRRSSDNSETNIGFVNNYVDTASILSFCGAGSGFVSIFYDQSGNGNNAIQNTAVSQPRICLNGALNLVNGKLSLFFDGTNDYLQFTQFNLNVNWSNFMVAKRQSLSFPSISGGAVQGGLSPYLLYTRADNRLTYTVSKSTSSTNGLTYTGSANDTSLNLRSLYTAYNSGGIGFGIAYINNSIALLNVSPTQSTTTYLNISAIGVERTTYGFGNMSENILYLSLDSFSRTDAIANQINYFSIV